jgi:hypothetical protein
MPRCLAAAGRFAALSRFFTVFRVAKFRDAAKGLRGSELLAAHSPE